MRKVASRNSPALQLMRPRVGATGCAHRSLCPFMLPHLIVEMLGDTIQCIYVLLYTRCRPGDSSGSTGTTWRGSSKKSRARTAILRQELLPLNHCRHFFCYNKCVACARVSRKIVRAISVRRPIVYKLGFLAMLAHRTRARAHSAAPTRTTTHYGRPLASEGADAPMDAPAIVSVKRMQPPSAVARRPDSNQG
eukprot:COSAG03_NODE_811_length_5760_cov_3.042749_2_plen_193_part_00